MPSDLLKIYQWGRRTAVEGGEGGGGDGGRYCLFYFVFIRLGKDYFYQRNAREI